MDKSIKFVLLIVEFCKMVLTNPQPNEKNSWCEKHLKISHVVCELQNRSSHFNRTALYDFQDEADPPLQSIIKRYEGGSTKNHTRRSTSSLRDLDHRDLEHLSDVEEEERQSLVGVKRYAQNIAIVCMQFKMAPV